ncbi:OXIDASE putative-RELATED [Salix purpurea]|uniref:cytokinin dehydrogenase n=1 Tax=Salix purpurea TaxID=77065 RepID=A0A9Q0V3Q1_SALPP|nr:OXIDASE putative-RELATED [Salix purpurea]
MAKSRSTPIHLIVMLLVTYFLCTVGKSNALACPLPPELATKLHVDQVAVDSASSDYGNIVHSKPAAVLYPSSIEDIQRLVRSSYNCPIPFGISVRGNGHSVNGQDMARDGVVVDMKSLRENKHGIKIRVYKNHLFADVGGEQLWIDVLHTTAAQGLSPVSWTDFLYLSVGGTLSNAGISGQTFLHGPQISNVYELDVITGNGELVTCSKRNNSDLFDSVLGGLGQFGIITRARIALRSAPAKVRWSRAFYSDFSGFIRDQERIARGSQRDVANYLEGSLVLDNGTPTEWITSFFPPALLPRIMSLVKKHGIIYCLELTKYYFVDDIASEIDQDLQQVFKDFAHVPGFIDAKFVSHQDFLTRVPNVENESLTHPWQNLFIPKSRISDFNSGVLREIVLKRNITTGPVLFYPLNRHKWDAKSSAVIPDEEIFYTTSFLHTGGIDNWQVYDDQNKAVVRFCEEAGIKIVKYLADYTTIEEWIKHFGSKWTTFRERKAQYDPKNILSPGQKIFNGI